MPFVALDNKKPAAGLGKYQPMDGPRPAPQLYPGGPEMNVPGANFITDVGHGFNSMLATAVGAPVDVVRRSMAGWAGQKLQDPWQTYNFLMDNFVGPDDPRRNEFADSLGKDLLPAMLGAGALAALGPGVAAGASNLPKWAQAGVNSLRSMGQEAVRRPLATAATEVGASFGATEGRRLTEGTKYEPMGTMVGALAGGYGAGRMAATSRGLARAEVGNDPLISGNRDASLVPLNIKETVDDARNTIDSEIKAAVNSVMLRNPKDHFQSSKTFDTLNAPIMAARKVRQSVVGSVNMARDTETKVWEAAGLDRPVAVQDLKLMAQQILAENEGFPDAIPGRLIRMIDALPDTATVGALVGKNSIRGEALKMLRNPNSQGVIDYNLNQIQDQVLKTLDAAFPGDKPIQDARGFSAWVNDRFFRPNSPLRIFLRRPVEQDAGEAMQRLIGREIGGSEVSQVSTVLDHPALVQDAARYLRDDFRATAAEMGPEDAAKWLAKPEVRRFMREMPQQTADLQVASDRLKSAFDTRKVLDDSVFTKIAGKDVKSVISSLYNTADKGQATRNVVQMLTGSSVSAPAALEGFQHSLIMDLFERAGRNPTQLADMIKRRDISEMLDAALPGPMLDRFRRLTADAAAVQAGDVGKARSLLRRPVTILAGIMGALSGRALNTGTIQTPGIAAGVFRRMSDRLLGTVDPSNAFALGVIDPRYEKVLHATIPRNRREAANLMRAMQLSLSAMTAQGQTIRSQLGQDNLPEEVRP